MSAPLELFFHEAVGAYDALWHIGGLVVMDPAVGDHDGWLLHYRSGLRGMFARLMAVDRHYVMLHQYQQQAETTEDNPNRWGIECEYHAGLIFFGMDSSLECSVFALNALGFAKDRAKFCDITQEKGLRGIGPANILGSKKEKPQPGYAEYFRGVKDHWEKDRDLISRITDYHDVSKHRSSIAMGGREGVLHLQEDPKQPGVRGSSTVHTLQSIAEEYWQFMEELLPIMVEAVAAAFGLTVTRRDLRPPPAP
jgi:hypothetical protein